ncbi:MBOAT family protein [Butyrivibrio sp. XB500-5]|uniref:MBOAT family O-acyltransferase n=1 Tax=Butyrivibrio sp. XB500-5 TaxID=2364880 RepID=UPI000EA98690|nr:MBOAT family protein [Butyrivibrio sp. XB500-5]RKM59622.1 MBOAT family protein [Butyrivibrio sp. XB500-5]
MSITSFSFLCFVALVLIAYYAVPLLFKKRGQWVVLLISSIIFYLFSVKGDYVQIVFPLVASFVTWGLLKLLAGTGEEELVKRRLILAAELAVLLGILIVFKFYKFITGGDVIPPTGLSFYTFILLGYFIEVYNGIGVRRDSFLQTTLVGMFFPLMVQGPIIKTREHSDQFFEYHKPDYKNLTFGAQRMLWGFFKWLVISQRLKIIVDEIYNNNAQYPGAYIWLGTVCFAFQLYTNFSGGIDIVIGLAEMLGIILPENFTTPFFAKNISEYWRRWHATLGIWMKDNVFYPLLRTKMIMGLGKKLKNVFGKKKGKQITTYVAMFILWFSVGLWHGGAATFVIGSGLLHWAYIVLGEVTLPFFTWLFEKKLHINMQSKFANGFRVMRTFFFVCIGDLFFRSKNIPHALSLLKGSVSSFNPQIFVDGSLLNLGLSIYEWGILLVTMAVFITVSVIQYRMELSRDGKITGSSFEGYSNIREYIASKKLVIRWIVYLALFFTVLLLAEYGPGFNPADSIYDDF